MADFQAGAVFWPIALTRRSDANCLSWLLAIGSSHAVLTSRASESAWSFASIFLRSRRSLASEAPAMAARLRDLSSAGPGVHLPIRSFDNFDRGEFEGDLGLAREEAGLNVVDLNVELLFNFGLVDGSVPVVV